MVQATWAREIWITDTRSQSACESGRVRGKGTKASPFHGDFDAILARVAPYTTIKLTPGTFYMRGHLECCDDDDGNLKSGHRMFGAGIRATTIKLNSDHPASSFNLLYGSTNTVDVHVADMTVDLMGTAHEKYKRNGVVLKGSHSSIRRVRAINAAGNFGNRRESFVLYIGWRGQEGNILEDCLVEQVHGNYVNGLNAGGGRLVIRNNIVILPRVTCRKKVRKPDGHLAGINLMYVDQALIEGNFVLGGKTGVYNDTGYLTNVNLTHNIFSNVWNGVVIANNHAPMDRLLIDENSFQLDPTADWSTGCHAVGINIWNRTGKREMRWSNIEIRKNTIKMAGYRRGTIRFVQLVGNDNILGTRIHGNIVNPGATLRLRGAKGTSTYANQDFSGKRLP